MPGRALVHPPAVPPHPALPDERLGQPVGVLREVVAEAALHAGGAHVRGVLLDPRAGHAHDRVVAHVQVHLTADAAVRADRAYHALGRRDLPVAEALAGQDLVDGPGRAHPYALAAPGAGRVIRVAVPADHDLSVRSAQPHLEHADLLDVGARPHAARAQDARAHVVADHRVAGPLVAVAQRELVRALGRDAHRIAPDEALELVQRVPIRLVGVQPLGEVVGGIAREQQPQHAAAVGDGRVGLGLDHQVVLRLRRARRGELGAPLDAHEADPTRADHRQLRVPAQRRHLDTGRAGGLEDRRAVVDRDRSSVDRERGHLP